MHTTNPVSLKIKIALVVTILFWASAFAGIRAGLEGYSPGGMALLRFLVASVCLFLIYLKVPRKAHIPIKDACLLLIIGAATIGTYHIALNYGEQTITSGAASFILSLMPVFTVLLAGIFLKEKINKKIILGVIVSVFGVGLMSFHQGEFHGLLIGYLCATFSALMGGVYSVLQKPFLVKYHAVDVAAYIMWGATLFLLIFTPDLIRDFSHTNLSATISTIYLGIFPAAGSYVLWSYVLTEMPATRAAVSLYFLPVLATFLGWIWLGEVPTSMSFIGGLVILLGVWIVNQSYHDQKT